MFPCRGPLTNRGHEICTHPLQVDSSLKLPEKIGMTILDSRNVQGLEQGLYIVSQPMPRLKSIPEVRHHMFLQVYQLPDAKQGIDRSQACVDQLEENWLECDHNDSEPLTVTERQKLKETLDEAKRDLQRTKQNANRALMMQVYGPSENKRGTSVYISSVMHGHTINRDLNDPYLVISPILTKSDVEANGGEWTDPDFYAYADSLTKVRETPYRLLGRNCKEATLEWVKAGLDAMPGLTSEMRQTAQANMNKPINSNTSLVRIVGNTIGRHLSPLLDFFKRLTKSEDNLPKVSRANEIASVPQPEVQDMNN